jgi:hypothetical protein
LQKSHTGQKWLDPAPLPFIVIGQELLMGGQGLGSRDNANHEGSNSWWLSYNYFVHICAVNPFLKGDLSDTL